MYLYDIYIYTLIHMFKMMHVFIFASMFFTSKDAPTKLP